MANFAAKPIVVSGLTLPQINRCKPTLFQGNRSSLLDANFLSKSRKICRQSVGVRASAETQAVSAETRPVAQSSPVDILKLAARRGNVPASQVLKAALAIEKQKLPADGFLEGLGGSASPGNRWRLVFTSGTKEVQEVTKGKGGGGGFYFPLTAAQRWDATKMEIENGIYLGFVGALSFKGPFIMSGRKLAFTFESITLKVGPFKTEIKLQMGPATAEDPKAPFFLFAYVDKDICLARGRGGGIALWARTSQVWDVKQGIV